MLSIRVNFFDQNIKVILYKLQNYDTDGQELLLIEVTHCPKRKPSQCYKWDQCNNRIAKQDVP